MLVVRYVIADDHQIFRQGLRMALSDDDNLCCVGEAENGNQLLNLVASENPEVAIVDLKMPEMDGEEATKALRKIHPELKIIVLSMYEEESYILQLMELGANSYLLKNVEPCEIKTAIFAVVETGYYFNNRISEIMLHKIVTKNKPDESEAIMLTDREKRVLSLICKEMTNLEISKEIFLSPRTVEGIRAQLLEKIGVRNTAGLVVYAVKNGFV